MKSLRVLAGVALLWALSPALPASAADGKAVWAHHCKACHGPDGKGDTAAGKALKVPNLTGMHNVPLSMIVTTIKNGRGHMPKLGDQLSTEEIDAVAKYTQQVMSSK
jgi:mono/diheme cytochrome c family protein